MKWNIIRLPVIIFLTGTFSFEEALADKMPSAMQALENAVRKEESRKETTQESTENRFREVNSLTMLARLQDSFSRGGEQADDALTQVATYFPSPAVQAAVENLRNILRAKKKAATDAYAAKIQASLARAAKAVKSSKNPADLDETIRDLTWDSDDRLTDHMRTGSEKIRSTRKFVVNWQDYLANIALGDLQAAIQNLRNASEQGTDTLLPRSELLAKIKEASDQQSVAPAARIQAIMAEAKSLNDLPAAISALQKIRMSPSQSRVDPQEEVNALILMMDRMEKTYASYQLGVPSQMDIVVKTMNAYTVNSNAERLVLPLRAELMRLVFPRYLEVEEKPGINETIQAYLDRMTTKAKTSLDGRLFERIAALMARLTGKQDSAGEVFRQLIIAQNQDEAEQYALAVTSYQVILKMGGDIAPAKQIGQRLTAIKSAHPAEFELGMQRFLAAPPMMSTRQRADSMEESTTITVPGNPK